jgi:N-acetylneuraminate synthase
MNEITIGDCKIGPAHAPFIIAEMSGNHNGSLEHALRLCDSAKAAGAHAIKLQTYTADTMTLDAGSAEFLISDPESLWHGMTLYQLYQQAATPWHWHEAIFRHCNDLGLIAFSTPFDASAVDFLEALQVPCYKIASLEILDLPLIRKAAATGKPLIISTGAATFAEIDEAVAAASSAGCSELLLFKCTSGYPTPCDQCHLRTLPHLAQSFGALVGLSDHTLGIGAAVASIALGACAIEKHIVYSRAEGGIDAAFSLEPAEFKALCSEALRAWQALGHIHYGATPSEKTSLSHRRTLYFVCALKSGDIITPEHIRAIRPGHGLPPKEFDHLIGRKVNRDVVRGEPVCWSAIEGV